MSNIKIIDYKIVTSPVIDFGDLVREAIKEGWQPYFLPTIFSQGDGQHYCFQAMVKYESE